MVSGQYHATVEQPSKCRKETPAPHRDGCILDEFLYTPSHQVYIRWRIEKYFKFKKQQFGFTDNVPAVHQQFEFVCHACSSIY